MYSEIFSKIYNEFGWNYYPEAFAEQFLVWAKQNAPAAESVLDLGCGTGVLVRILREHGFKADGVDLSENMIRIARRADPGGRYETGDMTDYTPGCRYDIVTCTGDALNHLTDPENVKKTFGNIYNYLEEGGFLIFDLLNETEISGPEPVGFSYDENTDASFQMTRDEDGTVTLRITVKEKGKEEFTEIIKERLYDAEMIADLLTMTGFRNVNCSHRLVEDGKPPVATWYVIAEK